MSEATIEAMDSDTWDTAGEAGFGYESEAEYVGETEGEGYADDARSDARLRARQQLAQRRQAQQREARLRGARLRQAQQRQAPQRRTPQPRRPAPTIPAQAVRAEVRSLDLQTSEAIDALRKRLDEANRLAYRNAWAGEASVAASQVLDSFELGLQPHDWARALIRGAPTILFAPGKPRRPGIEGILFDPRVAGGALLAGIWAVGHFRNQSKDVNTVDVQVAGSLTVGGPSVQLEAVAKDKSGNLVTDATYSYTAATSGLLSIREISPGLAELTPIAAGTTRVTVVSGGKQGSTFVTVNPAVTEVQTVQTLQVQLSGNLSIAAVTASGGATLRVFARDKDGNPIPGVTVNYTPVNPDLFEVTNATAGTATSPGSVTLIPKNAGTTKLAVTAGGQQTDISVTITT
jgi:hypothetical protein